MNHQLTSGSALYARSLSFNNRLQVSSITATKNGSTIQSLAYGYGSSGTNNGNLLSITNGTDGTHSRDESFSYDNLNRLSQAHDGTHWGEGYVYDNWGNMYQDNRLSGYPNGGDWNVTVNGSNQLSNLSYDTAGQVTQDQIPNSYSYDAEGRLLTAGSGSYVYDGDGYRVKTASSTTTLYWPGAVNGIIDESDSSGTNFGQQVKVAGRQVWSKMVSGTGVFMFQDHLGSTRVTGDSAGNLKDDIDYYPYGGIEANYGAGSGNHYVFTGYESDAAQSSTDYAVFRNLSYTLGRFNRPDPYAGSYDLTNPQSLNRYAYVGNRPLLFSDPLGLDENNSICTPGIDWSCGGSGDHHFELVSLRVVYLGPVDNPDPSTYQADPRAVLSHGGGQGGPGGGGPGGGGGAAGAPSKGTQCNTNCHRPSVKPMVVPQKNTPFCQQAYNNWQTTGNAAEWDGGIAAVATGPAPPVAAVFGIAAAYEGTVSWIDHMLHSAFCSQ